MKFMSLEKLKEKILNEKTFSVMLLIIGIVTILSFVLGLIAFNNEILFLTFLALLWYAWETRKLKEEAIKQTEIEQKPVMMLHVRNPIAIALENKEYEIIDGLSCYLSLRNVGRGPAFNVEVVEIKDRGSIFVVEKCQCRFFAPKGDEQAIKFIKKDNSKKDNSKIESFDELKNIIFKISCKGADGRLHAFQYKIIDIEKQEVEYLDK
jgi:hypothetical protein